jgi:tetratricopeptide (TPR) repeat protein
MDNPALDDLLEKAKWAKKNTAEQSDLYAAALKLAEASNDTKRATDIRGDYIDSLVFQGRYELAIPHFAILLSVLDQPGQQISWFEQIQILWRYKWFVSNMTNFPNVPKVQIEQMLADMEKRYVSFNPMTFPTIFYFKQSVYNSMGDHEKAAIFEKKFKEFGEAESPLYSLKDCDACECSSNVSRFFWRKQYNEALAEAAPILSGSLKCETVPRSTYPAVILSEILRDNGDPELAEKWFKKAIKLLNADNQEMVSFGKLICYLTRVGNTPKAISLFESQFWESVDTNNLNAVFHFYNAAWYLFDTLVKAGTAQIKLSLPENERLYSISGQYVTAEVVDFLQSEVLRIAALFDARNGNDHYVRELMGFYDGLRK